MSTTGAALQDVGLIDSFSAAAAAAAAEAPELSPPSPAQDAEAEAEAEALARWPSATSCGHLVDGGRARLLSDATTETPSSSPAETEDARREQEMEAEAVMVSAATWTVEMTPQEAAAVNALRAELIPGEEEMARSMLVNGELLDTCFLRFLKYKDLQVKDALKALRADWLWRVSVGAVALAESRPEQVACCDLKLLQDYAPTWLQGFDKTGQPLIFSHFGKFRFPHVLKQTTVENLLKLHIHNSERISRIIGQQSLKHGRNISSVLTIIDAEDWDPGNLRTMKAFQYTSGMASIDAEHFPERLGKLFVINAPKLVWRFWQIMQYTLPEKTRNCISLFAEREQWEDKLLELVDPDQLPPEYGGCGVHRGCEGIPLVAQTVQF